jgi:hypothetical protein
MVKNILWTVGVSIIAFSFVYPAAASLEPTYDGYKNERKVHDDLFQLDMFPGWFKPICDVQSYKGSSRLVVKLTADGGAILNPKGEELGWSSDTIDLHGLTLENAEKLWGSPRGMTFDLLAGPRLRSNDRDVYHLDTKFTNGELTSYKLRGIDICKPEWINVE